jgi:hypothetical protein
LSNASYHVVPVWQLCQYRRVPEGAAHDPSGFVADLGKGFLGRNRRAAVLERREGVAWRPVGRFGSSRDADRALDEAVANGETADALRVVERYAIPNGILVIAGMIAVGAAIAIMLYIVFG